MLVLFTFFLDGMVLLLWGVDAILGDVYRIQGENYVLHCFWEVKQVRFQLGGSCSFPGRGEYEFTFRSFQGSDEEKWVVTGRGSIVKCRETSFEGEGFLKTP